MTELENKREMFELAVTPRVGGPIGGLMTYNAEHGFVEALLRGLRSGTLLSLALLSIAPFSPVLPFLSVYLLPFSPFLSFSPSYTLT
jgi:hypothetical protein